MARRAPRRWPGESPRPIPNGPPPTPIPRPSAPWSARLPGPRVGRGPPPTLAPRGAKSLSARGTKGSFHIFAEVELRGRGIPQFPGPQTHTPPPTIDAPPPNPPYSTMPEPPTHAADLPARRPGVVKVRYTHEAMIDLIIQNPGISQNDLAACFGYSPPWVSTVMGSDAFKARLAERREQLVDPEVALTLRERFEALARQSLRVLQEKVSLPSSMVPDNLALRAAELGAKALGLGQTPQQAVVLTSEERLASLANRLIALRGGQGESDVVDV